MPKFKPIITASRFGFSLINFWLQITVQFSSVNSHTIGVLWHHLQQHISFDFKQALNVFSFSQYFFAFWNFFPPSFSIWFEQFWFNPACLADLGSTSWNLCFVQEERFRNYPHDTMISFLHCFAGWWVPGIFDIPTNCQSKNWDSAYDDTSPDIFSMDLKTFNSVNISWKMSLW